MCTVLVPWIEARDVVVKESVGVVDLEFLITRGDNSDRTRAFAATISSTAVAGMCMYVCFRACVCVCMHVCVWYVYV